MRVDETRSTFHRALAHRSSDDEIVEAPTQENARSIRRAIRAVAEFLDQAIERLLRCFSRVHVETGAFVAHETHDVARAKRDLRTTLCENGVAHAFHELRKNDG